MDLDNINVLVCGSRGYMEEARIHAVLVCHLDTYLNHPNHFHITFLHGACKNCADEVVSNIQENENISVKAYPAEWNKYGKRAAYIRNKAMVDDADIVIAFWDGKSKGTKMTIDLALASRNVSFVYVDLDHVRKD